MPALNRKSLAEKQDPRPTPIVTTQPFELVSIDFMHLDRCAGGYEYILVIVDHYASFAQAYATTTRYAKYVPNRIHHDMGGEWENQLFAQL